MLANVPPFLQNEIFLGLGNPVQESGTPARLGLLKMLLIDFPSQKTKGHLDSYLQILFPKRSN